MKVLVVGSVRDSADDPAEIHAAAREIGEALAKRGHTVLVGTDDPIDVDPSVVEGARSVGARTGAVEVHAPQGMPEPFTDVAEPKIRVVWHQFPDWDVTNMEVVRDVDAVLAIAGRAGVVQAGVSAWMLGVPIIAIACFNGGAAKLWHYGSSRRQEFYHGALLDSEIDRLAAPWGRTLHAEWVVTILEKVARAARLARTPRRLLYSVLGMMLLALIGWVAFLSFPFVLARLLSETGWNKEYTLPCLFGAVTFSGLLGAAMQTLRTIRRGEAVTGLVIVLDTALGIAAGIVTAVLYLLAQIGVTGTINHALDHQDYVRVALIVSSASVFAALYLDAALARFDKIKGSVLTGEHGRDDTEPSD